MEFIPRLSPDFVAGKYKSRATNNTKANSRRSASQVLRSALPDQPPQGVVVFPPYKRILMKIISKQFSTGQLVPDTINLSQKLKEYEHNLI